MKSIPILSPKEGELVFLYCDEARAYLEDGDYLSPCLVSRYHKAPCTDSARDIVLAWQGCKEAQRYRIRYGTEEEHRKKRVHTVITEDTTLPLRNLYKSSRYLWCIEALSDTHTVAYGEGSFRTSPLGPRVITVDGIANVRDVGGYPTKYGGETAQGRLYRSTCFNRANLSDGMIELTDAGALTLKDELGIQTELDIRNVYFEQCEKTRFLPLVRRPLRQYCGLIEEAQTYVDALRVFKDKDCYPIIYHCMGGADRTGTLTFCLGAILGYDDKILINDYEYTSFSAAGTRDKTETVEPQNGGIKHLLAHFDRFEGRDIGEKCLSFLLSAGLTWEDILAIRENMRAST